MEPVKKGIVPGSLVTSVFAVMTLDLYDGPRMLRPVGLIGPRTICLVISVMHLDNDDDDDMVLVVSPGGVGWQWMSCLKRATR